MKRTLPNLSCKYGAPMGRPNSIPDDIHTAGKLYLGRLKWIDWDYDKGGAYWGRVNGDYIYRATGETETEQVEIFVRAKSRDDAKEQVKDIFFDKGTYPKFYR